LPVSNTIGALRDITATILAEMLKLDLNLKIVGKEGKEGREWESSCEESYET